MISTTTAIMTWLSPATMHSLGWALLHFLWQGTALAALAAAAMALCRRASVRYVLGIAALVLMLLAPVATFFYSQDHPGQVLPGAEALKAPAPVAFAENTARDQARSAPVSISPSALPRLIEARLVEAWTVEAWLLGVAFFSLRTAGGFLLLERERRRSSSVVGPRVLEICYALQDRIGLSRAITYCECKWLQAPAVIGWFRPIVFLPATALTGLSEEQLQAVIAHELAHIRRFDAFVNVFQVLVETLLFYHPAVWWLNKKIRAEREHCCDDVAVSICGNAVEYARALTMMEEWRSAPAFAMAANRGPLTERIVRVLGLRTLGEGRRGVGLTASIVCLTAAIIAGNALLGMARPKPQMAFVAQAASNPAPTPQAAPKGASSPKPSPAHPQSSEPTAGSYIEEMKAAGLGDLTVDQLIAMKIQNVTPEYVRDLRELGLHPDAEKLVAMRVQDVTPEYVREMKASGLNPDENHLISLKIQGADAEYYRGIKDAGIDPDVDRLIALKIQGVTPEYVRALRAAGLAVTVDQVLSLKIQDVTPAYLKEMHELGIDPSTNDAISMRIQDVTPEYVREIHALGLKPATNELISMRIQDVTPEYVKALQSAGFKLEVHEIISAKIQDVTPEFIERARQHGFKGLTLQKLIQLRQWGILEPKADL
jgi:beta-lactamase regulating signal transducer with metallopeptidase domain